jgi:RNA polymerase sigma-70 factor (ECF subfamily)
VIGAAFRDTLAQAKAGEEAAFTRLFRDVQPALLRYLRLIAPDADDVAGDTWLQVVGGLDRFRGEEQEFRAWLFTIARHRAADSGRSRARRPAIPLEMTEAEQRPTTSDTADQALEAVSTQAVLELIASLPGDQAEIILLRVVAGLEAREVARIVGKSPGAVRVAAHRGLRKLADRTRLPDTEQAATRPGVTH